MHFTSEQVSQSQFQSEQLSRSPLNVGFGLLFGVIYLYAFSLAWPWLNTVRTEGSLWTFMSMGVVLCMAGLTTFFMRVNLWEFGSSIVTPIGLGSAVMTLGAVCFIGAGIWVDSAMKDAWMLVLFATIPAVGYAWLERHVWMTPEEDEHC